MRRLAVVGLLLGSTMTAAAGPKPASAHVVVAIIESTLNPYHDEFSRPELSRPPADFLPGYPRSARPLRLSLDEPDYATAVRRDDALWRGLQPGALYYLPRTNFVGLVHLPGHQLDRTVEVSSESDPLAPQRPIATNFPSHGTGVASVLAGRQHGSCPACLVVLVAADDEEQGLAWAARQPWIDVISNSWGGPLGAPTRVSASDPGRVAATTADVSFAAARSGKVVVTASGNGIASLGASTRAPQHNPTYHNPHTGPPWILTVGAARIDGQPTSWHNVPVDVIAHGEQWPSATPTTTTGSETFHGTSCAAPVAAGVVAEALRRTRIAVGDHGVGSRSGSLVHPAAGRRPRSGLLADGRLTRSELVSVSRAWAAWQPYVPGSSTDPFVTPTTSAAYAYQGYGLLTAAKAIPISETLLGRRSIPARPEMADWTRNHEAIRTVRWGPAPT